MRNEEFQVMAKKGLWTRPRALAGRLAGNAPWGRVVLVAVLVSAGPACRIDMQDQPRYEPLERSDFFRDRQSSRHLPEGTIARGRLVNDQAFATGKQDGAPVTSIPVPVNRELLQRGKERYEIFCSPCHGYAGYGDGMIVQRGFPAPPSYHIDRLREAPPGHFFSVITDGFGKMFSYASRIPPGDRWAIIAYLRALQLSQNATIEDVPADQRTSLEQGR